MKTNENILTCEFIHEEIKKYIPNILKGEYVELYTPYGIFVDVLEEYGFEFDDISTNGWQVDFWVDIKRDNIMYKVSGSMYYGGINICKI